MVRRTAAGHTRAVPELPEVETIRRQLVDRLTDRQILDAWGFNSPKFSAAPAAAGTTVTDVTRRGKYLLLPLRRDDVPPAQELIVHLGMTGRLAVTDRSIDRIEGEPHLRAWWCLGDGSVLTFHDVRRFGRIAVVDLGDHRSLPTLAALGPEPDSEEFTAEHLRRRVNAGSRRIKTVLLSQRVVAGVGNIYADEALWRAGVDPRARHLTRAAAARLRDAIRDVLSEGVDNGGTTLRDYVDADGSPGRNQHRLDCYGRAGRPCHRCGTELRGSVVDARSTSWCPDCQRRR